MSEQRPPRLIALMDEQDEEFLQRRLATEIRRLFPGINHSDVLREALRNTGDLSGAEDVAQDSYLLLLQTTEAQRPTGENLNKYVWTSIRNAALKWKRQHRPPQHHSMEADFAEKVLGDFADLVADQDRISFMLRRIPRNSREIFVQIFAEGRTVREVAELNDLTVEKVRGRIKRALSKLYEARKLFRTKKKRRSANSSPDTIMFASKESPDAKR